MTGVVKDPTLPHQICLTFNQDAKVVVSCNCWKTNRKATAFDHGFGISESVPESWALYNDPANHRGEPFVP